MSGKALFSFKRKSRFKRSLMLHTMTDNLKEALVSMRDTEGIQGLPPEVRKATSYRQLLYMRANDIDTIL